MKRPSEKVKLACVHGVVKLYKSKLDFFKPMIHLTVSAPARDKLSVSHNPVQGELAGIVNPLGVCLQLVFNSILNFA